MNIIFTYCGKEYNGELSIVQGAADNGVYHLTVDKYYKGRLRVSAFDNRWVFDGPFADLAEAYGSFLQVVGWVRAELNEDDAGIFYYLVEDSNC